MRYAGIAGIAGIVHIRHQVACQKVEGTKPLSTLAHTLGALAIMRDINRKWNLQLRFKNYVMSNYSESFTW